MNRRTQHRIDQLDRELDAIRKDRGTPKTALLELKRAIYDEIPRAVERARRAHLSEANVQGKMLATTYFPGINVSRTGWIVCDPLGPRMDSIKLARDERLYSGGWAVYEPYYETDITRLRICLAGLKRLGQAPQAAAAPEPTRPLSPTR